MYNKINGGNMKKLFLFGVVCLFLVTGCMSGPSVCENPDIASDSYLCKTFGTNLEGEC